MMKEGWKYKPFETCLEKVNITKKIPSSNYLKEGFYPVVSQEESIINGFHNNYDDIFKVNHPVVIFGDHTRILKYIDFDFVIGADGVKILSPIPSLFPKFFYYSLKSLRLPSLGYSRHYKLLKEQRIPVPPLSEQKRVVEELDLLSGIIEKQKQQLKELDTFAQSIFYDMFGDPVTNEKGWEIKKLCEVCSKITDGTHDTPERILQGVKFITGKHIRPFYIDFNNSDYVSEEVHQQIYARCNPEKGDILYTNIGVGVGTAAVNTAIYEFSMKNVALLKLSNLLNGVFLQYVLNDSNFKTLILPTFLGGGAQSFLSLKQIKLLPVIVPSYELQNLFASKIDAIEKQKADITKSIEETQKLFDYTMDKYFG